MTAFDSLRVELGTRSYNIIIGPGVIAESGAQIAPVLRQDRVFVVTDETVGARHLAPLQDSLCAQGIATQCLALPPGEGTKSFASLEKVIDWMLSCGVDRQSTVLAFGGGSSVIWRALSRRLSCAALTLFRFPQPCWPRLTVRLAARRASIPQGEKTLSGRSTNPVWSWQTQQSCKASRVGNCWQVMQRLSNMA